MLFYYICIFCMTSACIFASAEPTRTFRHQTKRGKTRQFSAPQAMSPYGNLTNTQVADLLRRRGFPVVEFPHAPPVVLLGDTYHSPADVLPELAAQARFTTMARTKLWLENDGSALTRFVYDSSRPPDKEIFQAAVDSWKKYTCIDFKQLSDAACQDSSYKPGQPAVCVGNYDGCHSLVGRINYPSGKPQEMSVSKGGCELAAAAHEFGHTLGASHQQSRPDRDKFITVHYNNFEVKLDLSAKLDPRYSKPPREEDYFQTCYQGSICKKDDVIATPSKIPLPYDYMSLMQYSTSDFADHDFRPVFIAKNAEFQYMIDYHRPAGLILTHYDSYAANLAYKCIDKWRARCKKEGKEPPKCRNFGYVGKECKCLCPPAYTGSGCEKQITPGVLYPVKKKAFVVRVNKNQMINMGTYKFLTDKGEGVLEKFNCYQFFTIAMNGTNASQSASLTVLKSPRPSTLYGGFTVMDQLISSGGLDCDQVLSVVWGQFSQGNCRRECLSTLIRNQNEGPAFRSGTAELGFFLMNQLGRWLGSDPGLTVKAMQFKMMAEFAPSPAKVLRVLKNPAADVSGAGKEDDSANTQAFGPGLGKGGIGIVLTIVIGVLLLVSIGAAVFWHKRRTRKQADSAG